MLKRLRENKSAQGTLLVSPTLVFMIGLLIIPLILTAIVSFGSRSADGGTNAEPDARFCKACGRPLHASA